MYQLSTGDVNTLEVLLAFVCLMISTPLPDACLRDVARGMSVTSVTGCTRQPPHHSLLSFICLAHPIQS